VLQFGISNLESNMANIDYNPMSEQFEDKLREYREKHNIKGLRKGVVHGAKNFLDKHTNLPEKKKDELILKSILETAKQSPSNYDGVMMFNNYEFGKKIGISCAENGIKIKKISPDAEAEIKESFSGTNSGVYKKAIEAVMDVLHLQPDLTTNDKEKILLISLKKTVEEGKKSLNYDGGEFHFNYEALGANVSKNVDALRKKKQRFFFEVQDQPYPPMRGEGLSDNFNNAEGGLGLDGFEEYEHDESDYEDFATLDQDSDYFEKDNFESLEFDGGPNADYDIVILEGEKAEYEGDDEYNNLSGKQRRQKRGSGVGNVLTGGVSGAIKRSGIKKNTGSGVANILTGGMSGIAHKAKAKKQAKQKAKDEAKERAKNEALVRQANEAIVRKANEKIVAANLAKLAEKRKSKKDAALAAQQAEQGIQAGVAPAIATAVAPAVADAGAGIAQSAAPVDNSAGGGGGGSGSGGGGDAPADSESEGESESESEEAPEQEAEPEQEEEAPTAEEEGASEEEESAPEEEEEEAPEASEESEPDTSERESMEYDENPSDSYTETPYFSFYEENKSMVLIGIVAVVAVVGYILWKKKIIKF
jgi:hypothetical protein